VRRIEYNCTYYQVVNEGEVANDFGSHLPAMHYD
jgi:hypothetical protein